jgi:hypothetical protein
MKKPVYFILTVAILFLSANKIFSQTAPNLNSAATFVLFTGNGEFTSNSPSTIVIGNVGNEVGVASAFPPGLLSGDKHFGDVIATQAGTDISAAYADLAARTCGTVHGVGFGGGEVLTPGVYCAGAASTWNGNITLDAGGNSSALFIIKIDGAFSSVAGSQIILLNNAAACNVFWQINGAVDLINTVFKGTMIVNGAINLSNGTIVDGRALATTGALIFGPVIVSICDAVVLPLQLVNFDVAKTKDNNVEITWITAAEINMAQYEVQASINGSTFFTVGTVTPKGNNFPTSYSIEDLPVNKTGVRFYRLKMVDRDGSFSYSAIKSIKFSDIPPGLVSIFPNPAGNTINISVQADAPENVIITITNLQGQNLIQKMQIVEKGSSTFAEDIQTLAKGTYIVSMKNINSGTETRQKLQKL